MLLLGLFAIMFGMIVGWGYKAAGFCIIILLIIITSYGGDNYFLPEQREKCYEDQFAILVKEWDGSKLAGSEWKCVNIDDFYGDR